MSASYPWEIKNFWQTLHVSLVKYHNIIIKILTSDEINYKDLCFRLIMYATQLDTCIEP